MDVLCMGLLLGLSKLDVIQYQAPRLCCGANKTTPVATTQVEMSENSWL